MPYENLYLTASFQPIYDNQCLIDFICTAIKIINKLLDNNKYVINIKITE